MSQEDSVKVEKVVWDQGLEEEIESAGSEHTSHPPFKNSGTKPNPQCSKQHSPSSFHPTYG